MPLVSSKSADPVQTADQKALPYPQSVTSAPSYDGRGLANLIGELEHRMTGYSAWSRLDGALGDAIPEAETYVLVLFDGLGVAQLEHDQARSIAVALAGQIEAPFPTTTSVSLSTVATGLPPSQHGQVAHLTWMEQLNQVVNCLKWVNLAGEAVDHNFGALLPRPNLWERLRASNVEPITVQPGDFSGSPLTRVLYRGARFEGVWDTEEMIRATTQLAREPARFIFTYLPHVDFAGHVYGLGSEEFADAMKVAVHVWEGIAAALPPTAALLGTADHGLVEFAERNKVIVRDPRFDDLRFAGDPRGVHMWAGDEIIDAFVAETGGESTDPSRFIGPYPTKTALSRLGRRLILAPPNKVILPKGFDKRLRSYHGGLAAEEVQIPLLVG